MFNHEEKKRILKELINVSSLEHLHKETLLRNQIFPSFVHRKEGIRRVIEAAKLNAEPFEKNKIKVGKDEDSEVKKFHNFIQIIGGSGRGKTRAALEIVNTLREAAKTKELPEVFSRTYKVYIDFLTGNHIGLYNENMDASDILGLRVFVATLSQEATVSNFVNAIDRTRFKFYRKHKVFNFDIVMEVLSQFYHQSFNLKQSELIPLVIILDQFQMVLTSENGMIMGRSLLRLLGNYFCHLKTSSEKLIRDQFILVPVFVGTLPSGGAIDSISQSTGDNYIRYTLPMFPLPIAQKLARKIGIPSELFVGHELQRFWSLMGMIPRSLERATVIAKKLLVEI